MPRVLVDHRSASKAEYQKFRQKYPSTTVTWEEFINIIYTFNENLKTYILETGEKTKIPGGLGDVAISKKKRKRTKIDPSGNTRINLAVDWAKSKEKGKRVYIMNYHTEGYAFWWRWFKKNARFQHSKLWYFRATRVSSRTLAHYIKTDPKYQHIYRDWGKAF